MEVTRAGVVGSGTMGSGIAQVFAQSGISVTMADVNDQLVQKGLATIKSSLDRMVKKETLKPADAESIIGKIKGATRIEDLKECEIVVEAVFEGPECEARHLYKT